MVPVKDLLNKVKWDRKENPEDYELVYLDRVLKKEVKVKFRDVSVEDEFFVVGKSSIPLHRIVRVYKKGRLVWERKSKRL